MKGPKHIITGAPKVEPFKVDEHVLVSPGCIRDAKEFLGDIAPHAVLTVTKVSGTNTTVSVLNKEITIPTRLLTR